MECTAYVLILRFVQPWPPSDLDGGEACSFLFFVSNSSRENFRGTDHHTITANVLGGILRDALKVGLASLVPTL